ncbi:MAG: hypothetical protein IMF16_06960 [Proteobacteria bacterium]|nr:hypothetical protein [Pseudomonadota bacterium]
MTRPREEDRERAAWIWIAAAVGAGVAAAGAVWLVRYRDPDRRMARLLHRCQDRIDGIETSLGRLESSVESRTP